jgi:hypothetical protein
MAEREMAFSVESSSTSAPVTVDDTNSMRTIVNNVVNHPQFRSLLNDAVGSSRQTPEHINRSRTNTNNATTTNSSANLGLGRSTYSSPVEEFRSIFRFGSTQGQQGGGTVASFSSIGSSIGSSTRARSRSRNRRSQRSSASTSINPCTNFAREVVLVNSPTDCTTVRGKAKADLIKNGQVISSFDFKKGWSDDEIEKQIGLAFEEKLQGSRFVAIPFDN